MVIKTLKQMEGKTDRHKVNPHIPLSKTRVIVPKSKQKTLKNNVINKETNIHSDQPA